MFDSCHNNYVFNINVHVIHICILGDKLLRITISKLILIDDFLRIKINIFI